MYHLTGPDGQITFSRHWIVLIVLVLVWEIVWKGVALWKAGRNKQLAWFIVLLLVNTLGLLEIAYLLYFQEKTTGRHQEKN